MGALSTLTFTCGLIMAMLGYVICSNFLLKGGQEAWYLGVPVGLSISFQTTIQVYTYINTYDMSIYD